MGRVGDRVGFLGFAAEGDGLADGSEPQGAVDRDRRRLRVFRDVDHLDRERAGLAVLRHRAVERRDVPLREARELGLDNLIAVVLAEHLEGVVGRAAEGVERIEADHVRSPLPTAWVDVDQHRRVALHDDDI